LTANQDTGCKYRPGAIKMPRPKQRSESRTLIAAEVPREQLQADEWFKALQPDHCMFCQSTEWAPGWSPMTFIRCSGCSVKAFHVGCLQKSGLAVTQDVIEDDADVFCSQARTRSIKMSFKSILDLSHASVQTLTCDCHVCRSVRR
jgi:hypothetical protein